MIEKQVFAHMPKAKEAGGWMVVYYGSSQHLVRAAWLGMSLAGERHASLPRFRWR